MGTQPGLRRPGLCPAVPGQGGTCGSFPSHQQPAYTFAYVFCLSWSCWPQKTAWAWGWLPACLHPPASFNRAKGREGKRWPELCRVQERRAGLLLATGTEDWEPSLAPCPPRYLPVLPIGRAQHVAPSPALAAGGRTPLPDHCLSIPPPVPPATTCQALSLAPTGTLVLRFPQQLGAATAVPPPRALLQLGRGMRVQGTGEDWGGPGGPMGDLPAGAGLAVPAAAPGTGCSTAASRRPARCRGSGRRPPAPLTSPARPRWRHRTAATLPLPWHHSSAPASALRHPPQPASAPGTTPPPCRGPTCLPRLQRRNGAPVLLLLLLLAPLAATFQIRPQHHAELKAATDSRD